MYAINANFGDSSIAAIQWCVEQGVAPLYVVYVKTGWEAVSWQVRLDEAESWVKKLGFQWVVLDPKEKFTQLVEARKHFPSVKFQWCASIMKGLPFLAWLDELDPSCEAIIIQGKSGVITPRPVAEYLEESEHHGFRKAWYPLHGHDQAAMDALLKRAGFEPLHHRSQECDPCIHSIPADFKRLAKEDILRLAALEKALGKPMFEKPIQEMVNEAQDSSEDGQFVNMGCGDPFGCGD